jgi:hypothetical protein
MPEITLPSRYVYSPLVHCIQKKWDIAGSEPWADLYNANGEFVEQTGITILKYLLVGRDVEPVLIRHPDTTEQCKYSQGNVPLNALVGADELVIVTSFGAPEPFNIIRTNGTALVYTESTGVRMGIWMYYAIVLPNVVD